MPSKGFDSFPSAIVIDCRPLMYTEPELRRRVGSPDDEPSAGATRRRRVRGGDCDCCWRSIIFVVAGKNVEEIMLPLLVRTTYKSHVSEQACKPSVSKQACMCSLSNLGTDLVTREQNGQEHPISVPGIGTKCGKQFWGVPLQLTTSCSRGRKECSIFTLHQIVLLHMPPFNITS